MFPTPTPESVLAQRHAAIRQAITPLPGSVPRDHFKPVNIPGHCDGLTLLAALERMVWNVPAAEWQEEFARGRIVNAELKPAAPAQIVRAGQSYRHLFPNVIEPAVNGAVEILYEDEALIVVNKPAPLPMHAGGRFYLNTLQHILNAAYHPQQPYPACPARCPPRNSVVTRPSAPGPANGVRAPWMRKTACPRAPNSACSGASPMARICSKCGR